MNIALPCLMTPNVTGFFPAKRCEEATIALGVASVIGRGRCA